MSTDNLNLTLHLLYNDTPTLSFDAFANNESLTEELKFEKISETPEELVIMIDENKTTFKKVAGKSDIDYDAYQEQADLFKGQEFFTFRQEAIDESKDHSNYIEITVETNEETPFMRIQSLFIAALCQVQTQQPVGVYVPENDVLLSIGDFTEFGINQITEWGMYIAWFNICGREKKGKVTIYTKGIKKLGEKDLEITVKEKKKDICTKFILNLVMNCLSTTSSYEDGETCTNILEDKDYEFAKKKSKFLDHKVLELEKW